MTAAERTYRWQDLSKPQQDAARRARDQLAAEGWGITVSQLAKHLDSTMAWTRGELSAQDLAARCNGVRLDT